MAQTCDCPQESQLEGSQFAQRCSSWESLVSACQGAGLCRGLGQAGCGNHTGDLLVLTPSHSFSMKHPPQLEANGVSRPAPHPMAY